MCAKKNTGLFKNIIYKIWSSVSNKERNIMESIVSIGFSIRNNTFLQFHTVN